MSARASNVLAGQIWRAPADARGHYRYVRVEQVRAASGLPYAICREVSSSGEYAHGRTRNGLLRSESFTVGISAGKLGAYTRPLDDGEVGHA